MRQLHERAIALLDMISAFESKKRNACEFYNKWENRHFTQVLHDCANDIDVYDRAIKRLKASYNKLIKQIETI
jgi:hypothetical protein